MRRKHKLLWKAFTGARQNPAFQSREYFTINQWFWRVGVEYPHSTKSYYCAAHTEYPSLNDVIMSIVYCPIADTMQSDVVSVDSCDGDFVVPLVQCIDDKGAMCKNGPWKNMKGHGGSNLSGSLPTPLLGA